MAIGTAAAIGLGVAGVGAAMGASSNKKAANKAADTSMAVAQQNNALTRDIYDQNKSMLSPYVQTGNAAGAQMNALLGLAPAQQTTGSPNYTQYVQSNPDLMAEYGRERGAFGSMGDYGQFHWNKYGQNEGRAMPGVQVQPAQTQQTAQNAFDTFRNSTGYQFRLGEGMNALNSGYAGAGTLQSGAAMKAATEYGQNFASNEFGNYMGYLGNQQGVGLSGASALAGVGQNYANTISANNNNAGDAAANAALIKGQNNPFANALGVIGGGFLGGM